MTEYILSLFLNIHSVKKVQKLSLGAVPFQIVNFCTLFTCKECILLLERYFKGILLPNVHIST